MSSTTAARLAARLTALTASVVVSLLLTELLVRLLAPQPRSWLEVYQRHPALPFYALQPDVEQLVDTGETRWHLYTNARGHRSAAPDARVAEAGDPRPTILVLGDSFTFGQGVDHEQTYVSGIEEALGGAYRMLNTSVGGYGPVQYRQILEWELGRGMRPRAVLVGIYLGNDILDCLWNKDVQVVDGTLGGARGPRAWLKRRSHLYRLTSKAFHRVFPGETARDRTHLYDPEEWASGRLMAAASAFREEMAGIAALVRRQGVPLIAAVLPTRESVAAQRERLQGSGSGDLDLPRRRTLELLAELDIAAVDLTPSLASEPTSGTYLSYDGHWTARGHELAAATVAEALSELLRAHPRGGEPGARAGGALPGGVLATGPGGTARPDAAR